MNDIHWPAFLQYDNDPELEYLKNPAAWHQLLAAAENDFEVNDHLIDCEGQVFSCQQLIQPSAGNSVPLETMPLETVLGLIKAHLADSGSCCVAKTYAPTIRDAISILESSTCDID